MIRTAFVGILFLIGVTLTLPSSVVFAQVGSGGSGNTGFGSGGSATSEVGSGGSTNTGVGGGGSANQGGKLTNPLKSSSLEQLLVDVLGFVKVIGGIIIMIMLVLVGFKFVAAQGKEEALREARAMLMWTVIGALILLGATAIQEAISATVGKL